jgi:ATP-dependent DNA helicase RecG
VTWQEGATTPADLALHIQRRTATAAALLDGLVHASVLEMSEGAYTLAEDLARAEEREPPPASPTAVILAYVETHGRITRREAVQFCGLTEKQAEYRLKQLVQAGRLRLVDRGRNAHYIPAG